jgi:hypothetical protein
MAVLDGISVRRLLSSVYNAAVIEERRARGFAPLGAAGAEALGLRASRARQLEIEAAWRRVAGSSLAERAPVIALRRGVLEIEVSDPAWRRALRHLLPELGARFAREHPALGVTRFRLVDRAPGRT